MSSYDFAQSEMRPVTPELEPNPLLMYLRKNLQEAAEREKETNMALATLTVEADAVTRERIAIERAIKAYQQDPRNLTRVKGADGLTPGQRLNPDEVGQEMRELNASIARHPAGKQRPGTPRPPRRWSE